MTSLDYLATKLNVNSTTQEPVIGRSSAGITIDTQHVYGALGMGRLSRPAYALGLAVYCKPDLDMTAEALAHARQEVAHLFIERNWNPEKPYRQLVNQQVKAGLCTCQEAEQLKARLGRELLDRITACAVAEILAENVCPECQGTGYIEHRPHGACNGRGRLAQRFTGSDRARFCKLTESAWKMTWQHRYQTILNTLNGWLGAFEVHLETHA